MISIDAIEKYNHSIQETVKFHEVDMMNVCNNAVYFNYFEDARIKYLQDLKKNYRLKEIMENDAFFIMVNNNCDYFEPAFFDEDLKVYTRIEFIKSTSFGFNHLIAGRKGEKIIAAGGGVLVQINLSTRIKIPLPKEFYDAVSDFENEVTIIK